MSVLTFPREPHRRSAVRVESWWGRALLRAIEEKAYDDNQLAGARSLARSGRIGGIVVEAGRFAAGVEDEHGLWTVSGTVPVLAADDVTALVEVLSASAAGAEALLDGRLLSDVAEHAEEAGVELVPYGEEILATCTCGHWHEVCSHALGVLHQLCWRVEQDALVLLQLRGVSREDLVARVPRGSGGPDGAGGSRGEAQAGGEPSREQVDDVEIALDAVLRARHMLDDPPP